ncbi:MAG TPA: hypothetical protein VFG58_07445 [Solirubrobacterales bacterium]|nr:hypothetical protein [Solirubrobacterales bacterium]
MQNTSTARDNTTISTADLDALNAHLHRMSVVFAVELRLKIVVELYMREMSPTRFYEEFGGGSLSRVTRNFERLAEAGWLEYIRQEGPGGRRRGGVEHFYRATELAYFDAKHWALLPYSIRVAFSWNSFKQIAARLRVAIEAGSVDSGSREALTRQSATLDRIGWAKVIEAIRAHFDFIFKEQEAAALRVARSGEAPIRASVVQIAFEPANDKRSGGMSHLVEGSQEPVAPLPVRLSKVFPDPVSMQIIREANRREISATQFHAELGGDSIGGIRRRFKKLEKVSLLIEVEARTGGRRRGATEKFYRATGPAISAARNGPWANIPKAVDDTATWRCFESLSTEIKAAMKQGTFDAREDSCLAWSLLQLDRRGWEAVTADLDALRRFVDAERERAQARMAESGESGAEMVVALTAFKSPKDSEREP